MQKSLLFFSKKFTCEGNKSFLQDYDFIIRLYSISNPSFSQVILLGWFYKLKRICSAFLLNTHSDDPYVCPAKQFNCMQFWTHPNYPKSRMKLVELEYATSAKEIECTCF